MPASRYRRAIPTPSSTPPHASTRLAGGFELAGHGFRRAAASLPSWLGVASLAFEAAASACEDTAEQARDATDKARLAARRYAEEVREGRERVKRLQREAEELERDAEEAERRAEAAAEREREARVRMADALLAAPLEGVGFSLSEAARSEREAEDAATERRQFERRAEECRERLGRVRDSAEEEHREVRAAERRAGLAVQAAAEEFPAGPGREVAAAAVPPFARPPKRSEQRRRSKPWSRRLVNESKQAIAHSQRAGLPTFERPDKLADHHMRHGATLGHRTAGEYQGAAQRLIDQGFKGPGPANPLGSRHSVQVGVEPKTFNRVFYRPSGNEFLVLDRNNVIRTYRSINPLRPPPIFVRTRMSMRGGPGRR